MKIGHAKKKWISIILLVMILASSVCLGCKQADAFSLCTPHSVETSKTSEKLQGEYHPLVTMDCSIRDIGLDSIQRISTLKRQKHSDYGRGLTVYYVAITQNRFVLVEHQDKNYLKNVMEYEDNHYIISYIHHSDGKKDPLSIF